MASDHPKHAERVPAHLREAFWRALRRLATNFSSAALAMGVTRPALYRAVGVKFGDEEVGKVSKSTRARLVAWLAMAKRKVAP